MTAVVLENLALLAEAPGGFEKARQLIRDLGISGWLIADAEPNEWPIVRLADVVLSFQNGVSSRGVSEGLPVTVLRLADIKNGSICLEDLRQLTLDENSIEKYRLAAGDVLVIRVNGSADLVGRFIVCESGVGLHCDHFIRLRLDPSRISASYLKLIGDGTTTRSAIQNLFVSTAGQKTVNQTHVGSLSFSLPPLPEQHRIVAKVEELMALCDRLEARQQDAETAHTRLVQALLDSLTQARDADEFLVCWHRMEAQFSDLVTTDTSLDALRAAVLELAFQGRLTAHGQNEPWQQVKLGSVAKLINGDRGSNYPNRSEYVPEGIAFINTGHINPDGSLDLDAMHYLTREKFESLRSGKIEPDDLVYCLRGATLGKTAFVRPFTEGAIASSLVILRFAKVVLPEFAYYFLVSPQGRRWIWKFDNGSAQPNLAASSVREYEMPLPSLDEQRQVVTRVTELLALCDQLKARIAAARAKHAQLAEALVAQAVA